MVAAHVTEIVVPMAIVHRKVIVHRRAEAEKGNHPATASVVRKGTGRAMANGNQKRIVPATESASLSRREAKVARRAAKKKKTSRATRPSSRRIER